MKKAIVLLISLFFISAISILVLKNLEDTDSYIKEQNHKLSKVQALALVKNIYDEAKRNSKDLDEVTGYSYPLEVEGIKAEFRLENFDKVDINLLKSNDAKAYKPLENLFLDYSISGLENLKYIYDNKKNEYNIEKNNNLINNSKQLDAIIETFIKETYNNKILELKDRLGFIAKKDGQTLYELFIVVKHLNENIEAYYIIDEKGEDKYFELSFK